MISRLVVLASALMLTTAQFQIQPHSLFAFPNVQPMQITTIPNSQHFMTQNAHSILNQDASLPLSPGVFTGAPILVSEATQAILDQEPKVIGYNAPTAVIVPPQNQQQFATGSVAGAQLLLGPQVLTFPVLSSTQQQQQPINVVPVRAVASLKDIIDSNKKKDYTYSKSKPSPSYSPRFKSKTKIHYDPQSDHQFPSSSLKHTEEQWTPVRSSVRLQPQTRDHILSSTNAKHSTFEDRDNEEITYMRPPPPIDNTESKSSYDNLKSHHIKQSNSGAYVPQSSESRSPVLQENSRTRSFENEKHSREENTREKTSHTTSRYHYDSNKQEDRHKSLKVESNQRDTAPQSSENFYQQQTPSYGHQLPPSYSRDFYTQTGGYSNSQAVVHKHIFVHSAPEQHYQGPKFRIIRPSPPPEKHVQVIFVKSPTPPPEPQTIIELPPSPPTKTVVYVMAKKPEDGNGRVRIIGPPPPKPLAPEIYFIRYGDRKQNQGYPVANLQSLYDNQDSYSQPQGVKYSPGLSLRSKRNKDGLDTYAPLMAYSTTGQINEITQDEAEFRRTNLDQFF